MVAGELDEELLRNLGQPMIGKDKVFQKDGQYKRSERPHKGGAEGKLDYDLYNMYQSFWMTMIPFTCSPPCLVSIGPRAAVCVMLCQVGTTSDTTGPTTLGVLCPACLRRGSPSRTRR